MGDPLLLRALLVVLLLVAACVGWWLSRRREGTFRQAQAAGGAAGLTAGDLGADLGATATFVQFSTSTCATCPQVRRMLGDLVTRHPGVAHVEVDAEASMDLVRRFGVVRTPTVLLLDAAGVVRSRTSGAITAVHAR
ncbi:MAG TPA: thioredoxin family protein, partial [Actinotalea sp.]